MSVAGKPNGSYIFNVVLPAEFEAVVTPTYFTDVKNVLRPTFGPDEVAKIADTASQGSSVLLWVDTESDVQGTIGGPATDICKLRVIVVGCVRQKDDVQAALQGLAADIRRVMRSNTRRTFPGALDSSNAYGRSTFSGGSPTFDFGYYDIPQSTTAGLVYSIWDIEYRFPIATG